jgi:pyruvate formate lyase activating enzyme
MAESQEERSASICPGCGRQVPVAQALGVCGSCIREKPEVYLPAILDRHASYRREFGLQTTPARTAGGALCDYCPHECVLGEGELGYCMAREGRKGRVVGGVSGARVSWYHDPLPTNCVADWICPGGAGAGYPRFAHRNGPETGYTNLAVFYESCNFHCLGCQNHNFREWPHGPRDIRPHDIARSVNLTTYCICFFGGDPVPNLPHSIKAARLARRMAHGRILRVCWETNGSMKPSFMKAMLALCLASGGLIKFDLKAWSEPLHVAMTGAGNRRTLENFAWLASRVSLREEYPLLVASTLMVPGLIDEEEVSRIAGFIASFSVHIPFNLLAFHPDCNLLDLPVTPRDQAKACIAAARSAGLTNVRLGNIHLLV